MNRRKLTKNLLALFISSRIPSPYASTARTIKLESFINPLDIDHSTAIINAHALGAKVIYGAKTYIFTSEKNPDLSTGALFNNSRVVGKLNREIYAFDKSGQFIGLQHNHLEQFHTKESSTPITSGMILPPPTYSPMKNPIKIDLIAHWYNDFGLQYTLAGKGKMGNLTWYYWRWAFENKENYHPERHPLLGWYRGDDNNVLDWQCYWLLRSGITGVNLVGSIDMYGWDSPNHKDYWKYQLFNNTKNFKHLKYILWLQPTYTNNTNSSLITLLKTYKNFHCTTINNKTYVTLYIFDFHAFCQSFENNLAGIIHLTHLAEAVYSAIGLKPLFLIRKLGKQEETLLRNESTSNGFLFMKAGYSNIDNSSGKTYASLVNSFKVIDKTQVINIATSKHSVAPHPSKWNWKGSTPKLFEELVKKALTAVEEQKLPRIIQIYNVSEWAEGGPGLQPNMRDDFGYLDAIEKAIQWHLSRKHHQE